MIKCEVCNFEVKNIKSLSLHIRKHNISSKEYYDKYLKTEDEGFCVECGKETNFNRLSSGYCRFCSTKCAKNNIETIQKIKQTNLQRYGVENPAQSNEIRNKIKETNLERYGVENYSQTDECKNKVKETNLERYGVEYCLQNKQFKEKYKKTCLTKYGVENYSQTEEYKNKVKETNLIRYNVKNYSQTDECKNKVKETNLERYNVSCTLHDKKIKEKVINTNIKRYGFENPYKNKEIQEKTKNTIKEHTIKKYKETYENLNILDYDIDKRKMICHCNVCNQDYFINILVLLRRIKYYNFINPCTNCFPIDGHFSNQEKELLDFIKSIYKGEIIENDRTILKGQELDIYLPEKKIAFEYNGLFWHCVEYKDKNYHLNKTIECEKQDIQLIHIFENYWFEKEIDIKNYIKELISGKINLNNSLVFKIENNTIFVDRSLNNGKMLENQGYKLIEFIEPKKKNLTFNNKQFNIYNCGYLRYVKI